MRVSGRVLRSRYLFMRERGDDSTQAVMNALRPGTRAVVEEGLLETRWYPIEVFLELTETIDRVLGSGDGTLCYEMGRYSCDKNLTTAHRLLFKFGNIGWLLDRAAKAWHVQFDEGNMYVLQRDVGSLVSVQLDGVPVASRAQCLAIKGWMVRAAELSGEDSFVCDELCRASGDDRCLWTFRWV